MENTNNYTGKILISALILATLLAILFSGCTVTYHMSDAEYSDARETHASITYYNNTVYWGWYDGYWWYYGKPHYYPLYYYYGTCPTSHYHVGTHIIISNAAQNLKPHYRPRPNYNKKPINNNKTNNKIIINSNKNNKSNIIRNNSNKSNINRNNSNKNNVKPNKSNKNPNRSPK